MRLLFGPQNDGLHIDPTRPGGYEWWYFDALSNDGNRALVLIFFLGSPMSPYYKAVVDGKSPRPLDWCGVFATLHHRSQGRWQEQAYAYNLYSGGDFSQPLQRLTIGASRFSVTPGPGWKVSLEESGLWSGSTRIQAEFNPAGSPLQGSPLPHEPVGEESDPHSWICVAPVCQVSVEAVLPGGEKVAFAGHGYHDHNFGQLPWHDLDTWYWGRAMVPVEGEVLHTLYYCWQEAAAHTGYWLTFDRWGQLRYLLEAQGEAAPVSLRQRSGYGLLFLDEIRLHPTTVVYPPNAPLPGGHIAFKPPREALLLADGPFYRRAVAPLDFSLQPAGEVLQAGEGSGISEIFQPGRLCHPLWSRLIWTRIRRR